MASTMKAIGYVRSTMDEDAIVEFQQPIPQPGPNDIQVQIQAVSVNPVDYKLRLNREPKEGEPGVLGYDAVGKVAAVGSEAKAYKVGDEVWYAGDFMRPGTNSEYHIVDERIVGRKPSTIKASQAAALPLTSLTAYEMLFDRLDVRKPVPGAANAVVIIGGAGGVGSIAIQLLRALTDLQVIATASRPETQAWCKELGAHFTIDHREPLDKQVETLSIGAPAFVFSTTHTDSYMTQIAELIAPQGRFGLIDDPDVVDISPFKMKAVSTHWELMFTRPVYKTADIARQRDILNEVADLIDAGKVKSTATDVMGKIDAATVHAAHKAVHSNATRGKIVLEGF